MPTNSRPVRAPHLKEMKRRGEPIAVLTAYDAVMARLFEQSGADVILVGDSVGMAVLGYASTIPVTMAMMVHHTQAVVRGTSRALVVADMPFLAAPLIRALAAGLDNADACLPSSGGPRGVEPLCAAYGPACRDAIAVTLDSGDRRAVGFHDRVKVGILSLDRIRPLGDPERIFFNINTAEDLAEADARWHRPASSR